MQGRPPAALPGTFVAVVGASGAGKDTVMRLARERLRGDPRIHFVRRAITRPPEPSEEHESLSAEEFAARLAQGGFALHWQAHGLHYGLPVAALRRLDRGHAVIANVSRTVVGDIAARFPRHAIVAIVADPATRETRIGARRREGDGPLEMRLRREVEIPQGCNLTEIANDGHPQDAAAAFAALVLDTLR